METIDSRTPASRLSRKLDCSPADLLTQIRELFRQMGIFDEPFSLEHEGNWYRISCDADSFMVYRVNTGSGIRHHVPGWPVCLVNSETIFEEHCSQDLGNDHCACGADIEKWLEIIEQNLLGNLPERPIE